MVAGKTVDSDKELIWWQGWDFHSSSIIVKLLAVYEDALTYKLLEKKKKTLSSELYNKNSVNKGEIEASINIKMRSGNDLRKIFWT